MLIIRGGGALGTLFACVMGFRLVAVEQVMGVCAFLAVFFGSATMMVQTVILDAIKGSDEGFGQQRLFLCTRWVIGSIAVGTS